MTVDFTELNLLVPILLCVFSLRSGLDNYERFIRRGEKIPGLHVREQGQISRVFSKFTEFTQAPPKTEQFKVILIMRGEGEIYDFTEKNPPISYDTRRPLSSSLLVTPLKSMGVVLAVSLLTSGLKVVM